MKLQFRHQKFQEDAAKAVVDVFAGQPYQTSSYRTDRDNGTHQMSPAEAQKFTGWGNQRIVPELKDPIILEHIRTIQKRNQIDPSPRLEGTYNLTVEMETGVGKTYTYIKTMYELNRHYGWSKFVIIVPSIAIREGVYKTFQVTQEHFAEEYGKKIRFFSYNSAKLTEIDRFASDPSINVMIINSQSFNAKGKDARRIYMKLDEFRSRRPIDMIAGTNPIVIIDEPQSVEGKQTKKNLEEFHPLMTLRYSATHKSGSIYNMVYRMDALEAYNRKLVKKIVVKGIRKSGTEVTDSYVYLEGIDLSKADPGAVLQFHSRSSSGIKVISVKAGIGFNLYPNSGGLEEYRNHFIIKNIDGRDDSIEFVNGIRLYAGDMSGQVSEEQLRRIQIRETILSHIERERRLFHMGIKVLSLFFIDEVAHYRTYDRSGKPVNGMFADMFEQEYEEVVRSLAYKAGEEEYAGYLRRIAAKKTHAGYFSIDKKGRMINSKVRRSETSSDDAGAYDLIMKNKELLLDRDPQKSPVRFIFSHSALKEGWDNPNVFQICTLKQSSSEVRKRQEVGRGMRLCVNEHGERMDESVLGADVHNINVLTVIASESYDAFAKKLQSEMAEITGRAEAACDGSIMRPENARSSRVELHVDPEKLSMPEFQALWSRINTKTAYVVDFDTDELVRKATEALDARLHVPKLSIQTETGEKYDLVGTLAEKTGLTRKAIIRILAGIRPSVFDQFKDNPEAFMFQAGRLIDQEKAEAVIRHISYEALDERYDTELFTDGVIKGKPGVNVMKTEKHLYDHAIYASESERKFIEALEASSEVAVYAKLPDSFSVSTPFGPYKPGWAIALKTGTATYPHVVAELRGSTDTKESRWLDEAKRHCAREHFRAVSGGQVIYDVADGYPENDKRTAGMEGK